MPSSRVLKQQETKGRSHCLVEWDEEGNPLTVVLYSAVSCHEGDNDLQVGDECVVTVKEGTKKVDYKAKLAGIGTKEEMEQLLDDLEEIDKSDSDQQDEEVGLQSQGEKNSAKTHNRIPVTKPKSAARKPKKSYIDKKSKAENDRITAEILQDLEYEQKQTPKGSPKSQSKMAHVERGGVSNKEESDDQSMSSKNRPKSKPNKKHTEGGGVSSEEESDNEDMPSKNRPNSKSKKRYAERDGVPSEAESDDESMSSKNQPKSKSKKRYAERDGVSSEEDSDDERMSSKNRPKSKAKKRRVERRNVSSEDEYDEKCIDPRVYSKVKPNKRRAVRGDVSSEEEFSKRRAFKNHPKLRRHTERVDVVISSDECTAAKVQPKWKTNGKIVFIDDPVLSSSPQRLSSTSYSVRNHSDNYPLSLSPYCSPSPPHHFHSHSTKRHAWHTQQHLFSDITNNIHQSIPGHGPPDQHVLSDLKSWLELHLRELHGKIDRNRDAINQLSTLISKKRSTKHGASLGDNVKGADSEVYCGAESFVSGQDESLIRERSNVKRELGPLEICLGDPDKSSCVYVNLPSQAALAQFKEVEGILPNTPSVYALRLFSIFFSEGEQAVSCCTKAKGRKLIDQDILKGMKEQINFKFPASNSVEAETRWHDIVVKSLNNRCRTSRKNLKLKGHFKEDGEDDQEN